jgi:outer membrane receptor protein involved in Fe transport
MARRMSYSLTRITRGTAAAILALVMFASTSHADETSGVAYDSYVEPSFAPLSAVDYVQPADEEVPDEPELDPLAELESLLSEPVLVREPVATTLSRVEEPVSESAGTIYVYPRELIFKRGYRSLAELLEIVPGFTVFHRDLDYVVGVRGFNANDNDKVSLLVNGQRILGMHEQDFLNGPINLDNVERVEVVVGPSSLFQQANTLAATINVITRNVDGVEAIAATGNALRYSGTVMAGRRWADDHYVSFSVTTEGKRGFDAWDPNFRGNVAGRKLTGELDQPNYFSVLRYQNGGLAVQAIAYRSTWPELHIANGSLANDGVFTEEYYSLFAEYEHEFNCALTGIVRAKVDLKESIRQNRDGPPENAVEQFLKQWTYKGELGLRYTGIDRHLIQFGVQAEYDHNLDTFFTFNDSTAVPEVHTPRTTLVDQDTYAVGFYFDDQIQVSDRLKLIAGFRFDKNTRLPDNYLYPGARAAVVYHTTEKWITKVTYNRSVRMPSALTALNQVWGTNNPDSPNRPTFADSSPTAFAPEILSTIELHNVFYIGENVRIGTIFYHEELQDFLTWFAPHSNGGNFRGDGFELTLDAEVNPCLNIWANCAYNDTKLNLFNDALFGVGDPGVEQHHAYINQNGRIIGSPEWTANLGVDWKITDCLSFSPTVRYFTEQAGVDQVTPTTNEFVKVRNRYYVDAALTWYNVWCRDMDLRLSGRNLFNNRQPVASQLNGDLYRPRGTELVLTLDMRF